MKTELQFGKIIITEQKRDAVHVAVAPVKAGEPLSPGQHISMNAGAAFSKAPFIGVVDPFLTTRVNTGDCFWIFLYPQTITSLRHEWTHPGFDGAAQDPKAESIAFLTKVANDCGVSYERMMDAIERDDYINMGENEHYKEVLEAAGVEFKEHCEIVLGKKLDATPYPFSCSC